MSTMAATTPETYVADLEELWRCFDELVGSMSEEDWSRKHGPDWTLADVPYHLAYFDRDIVATPIERGRNVPAGEQQVMRTMNELNAWNARKFAERPAGQHPVRSLEQMSESRDDVRRAIGQMSQAGLDNPVFIHLDGCGWLPARMALEACRAHTWEEVEEFRLVLERTSPRPSDRITHAVLGFFQEFMGMALDREEAKKTQFTLVNQITGPGGGVWTVRVAGGGLSVSEERAPNRDMVMTQDVETWLRTWVGWLDPITAIQTGRIQVRGMEKMETFGRLFPPMTPDRVIEPMGAPAPW